MFTIVAVSWLAILVTLARYLLLYPSSPVTFTFIIFKPCINQAKPTIAVATIVRLHHRGMSRHKVFAVARP